MTIKIDMNKCTGCAKCVPACPFGLMEIFEKKAKVKEGCTLCGACKDACNFEAIQIETVPAVVPANSDYHGVWVFAEQWDGKLKGVSYELLAKGRELANNLQTELCAVTFGHNIDTASLAAYGAEKVYLVDSPDFVRNPEDIYTRLLIDLIRQYKPEIVLAGATALGRSFIPRVAAVLGTGLTADCTGLEIDTKSKLLVQTRPTFGGNIMATIITQTGRPQMATVRPRTFKAAVPDVKKPGQIINVDFKKEQVTSKTKLLNFIEDVTQHVKLEEADIIVTGGRGLGKKENLKIIEELAAAMGAAVGSSRPLVDEGWIPYSHQVGQSGKTVTPKLYIACGVSGAFQHLVGMQTAECIVAINTDPKAPIFDVATYGIVGDLFTVIPMLIKKIKEK
jgi:electron transfer flavoprotein alpha subunit